MDRHFLCFCGGTAWVERENGAVTIQCSKCGIAASGETLSLAKSEWKSRGAEEAERARSAE